MQLLWRQVAKDQEQQSLVIVGSHGCVTAAAPGRLGNPRLVVSESAPQRLGPDLVPARSPPTWCPPLAPFLLDNLVDTACARKSIGLQV